MNEKVMLRRAEAEKAELVGLLSLTLDEISKLCEKDKQGKKYSGLWDLHAKIANVLDRVDP